MDVLDDDELTRRLDAMPVAEPPAELRSGIMAAVDSVWPRASARGVRAKARTHTAARHWLTAAWAAAAVLVLVFFLAYPHHERTDVAGTMAPRWPVVDRIANDRATLVVTRRGEFYALEAVINGARPVTAAIAWDEKTLAPTGVSLGFDASFRKDQVSFTLRNPSQRAGVIVRRLSRATTADIRVSVDNQEILRAAVPLD
jgi:hypothetical protein